MRIFKKFYEYKSVLSYLNEFNEVKLDKIYYDVQSVVAGLIFICNVNEEIVKKVN